MPAGSPGVVTSGVRLKDEGAVLGFVLLVAALGSSLVLMVLTVTEMAHHGDGSYRDGAEAMYAAEAALDVTIGELARLPSWSAVPGGSEVAAWTHHASQPGTALSGMLDRAALTQRVQAESDAVHSGADAPRWRVYAQAPFSAVWPHAGPVGDVYLVVWVADDPGDGDGDPAADRNERVFVRAAAFGRRGSHRSVEALVDRGGGDVVRQVGWMEVR